MKEKVYPINLNGEIHKDYIGVSNNKEYQIRRLELLIKDLKSEIKIRESMLKNSLKELNVLKVGK